MTLTLCSPLTIGAALAVAGCAGCAGGGLGAALLLGALALGVVAALWPRPKGGA